MRARVQVAGGAAIADTSAVTLANVAGATLDLNGTSETIGSLAGGGAAGGNVTLGAGTLTTGGNNGTTTYTGILSGAGGLTKHGTGIFTLSGANTYTGCDDHQCGHAAPWCRQSHRRYQCRHRGGRRDLQSEQLRRDDRVTGRRGQCHAGDRHLDGRRRQLVHHLLGRDERHRWADKARDRHASPSRATTPIPVPPTSMPGRWLPRSTMRSGQQRVARRSRLAPPSASPVGSITAPRNRSRSMAGRSASLAGNNTFAGPITLAANSAVTVADGTTMTVGGTVNGGSQLIVSSGTGGINFLSAIGGTTPLSSLSCHCRFYRPGSCHHSRHTDLHRRDHAQRQSDDDE